MGAPYGFAGAEASIDRSIPTRLHALVGPPHKDTEKIPQRYSQAHACAPTKMTQQNRPLTRPRAPRCRSIQPTCVCSEREMASRRAPRKKSNGGIGVRPTHNCSFCVTKSNKKRKEGSHVAGGLPPPRRVCTRGFLTSAHALSDGWATPKEASKQQVSTWSVHALVSHNQPNRISQSINQPIAPPIDRSRTRNPKFKSLNQLLGTIQTSVEFGRSRAFSVRGSASGRLRHSRSSWPRPVDRLGLWE